MKVILEYDPETGHIKDKQGVIIFTWFALQYFDEVQQKTEESISVKDTLLLTKYSADDLIKLKNAGII